MDELSIARGALSLAVDQGASYADVRLIRQRHQSVDVKDGRVDALTDAFDVGMGVRALVDGAWGFAANPDLRPAKVDLAVRRAVAIARSSARLKQRDVVLAPVPPSKGTWSSPCVEDPFHVSLDEKLGLLRSCDERMRAVAGVAIAKATMDLQQEEKLFASTEGTEVRQCTTSCGAGIEATSVGPSGVQTRTYPCSCRGNYASRGFEFIRDMALPEHAERVAREAVQLQDADQCPSGTFTVILGTDQLAIQVHESCGHPTELDRVFGSEVNYAGASFMTPDLLGNLAYGSERVTITSDATLEGSLGSFGWDDEGVPATRFAIVDRGRFVEYQTSRETASVLGVRPNGTMRAHGWGNMPLIRMCTVSLEPGDGTWEDLLADTDDGLLFLNSRSWSIDDRRWSFQFGAEIAWRIRKGRLAEMLKNPTYSGVTTEFWSGCDGVADRATWQVWGTPTCGKGQPGQIAGVAHGCSYARFRNVRTGAPMIGEARIRDVFDVALSASRADETLLLLTGGKSALARFSGNAVHQNVLQKDYSLSVVAAFGRRVGVAATNLFTPDEVRRCVELASEVARRQEEDPFWEPLGSGFSYEPVPEAYDEATVGLSQEERVDRVASIVDRCRSAGCTAAGAFTVGDHVVATANSHGLFACQASTSADVTLTVDAGGGATGWAEGIASSLAASRSTTSPREP